MAKTSAKTSAKTKEAQNIEKSSSEVVVTLKPLNIQRMILTIQSISPMMQHQWSEKAKRQMREKGLGKKTKDREPRKPEEEAHNATYFTPDGKYGIPLLALKAAVIGAAHKDIGIEKTLVRKAFFIISPNPELVIPIKCNPPVINEAPVRVGAGAADLRYRPLFDSWEATIQIEFDADLLRTDDIVNLVDRAGFGVGICERRPEKGGELGRFRVKR